ncbi:MAG: PHP domain-containing protein [Desulfobacterales bacterium]|nr:PHP domain-containing protein [Desulfobacterales bacterium]
MKNEIFADLHNHTTASDGDFSPNALVAAAKEKGIKALGITDHDTLGGIEKAIAEGERAGVEVQPGVEISVRFKRPYFTGTLHVLAYFSRERLSDKGFCSRFEALLAGGRGEGLVRARIEKINRIFGPGGSSPLLERDLVYEDISVYGENVSRRHFALALTEGFGLDDKEIVNRIIGNDSPAYLPSGVALAAVGEFIRNEPVVAVLAHPAAGSFPGEGHYKEVLPPVETVEKLMPEFLDAGVQGLEVFYPGHSEVHQKALLEWARAHGLLVTGGSDCHDVTQRPPGVCGITQEQFLILKEAVRNEDVKYS